MESDPTTETHEGLAELLKEVSRVLAHRESFYTAALVRAGYQRIHELSQEVDRLRVEIDGLHDRLTRPMPTDLCTCGHTRGQHSVHGCLHETGVFCPCQEFEFAL